MSDLISESVSQNQTCSNCQEFSNCGTVFRVKKENLKTKKLAYEYFKTNTDLCPDWQIACDSKG